MTKLTRKSPRIALRQANFKEFPGTDGLTSILKDTKENLLLNFEVGLSAPRREIYLCRRWDWNPGLFDPQPSALINRSPALPNSDLTAPSGCSMYVKEYERY